MSSPSSRYIAGYVVRAILGTALVLCAISAVRVRWIAPESRVDPDPPWDKALILPDRLVQYAFAKLDERRAAKTLPPAGPEPITPHQPEPTHTPTPPPPPKAPPGMPDMPTLPSMPETPGTPKLPEMPSMPSMPTLPGEPVARPTTPAAKPKSSGQWGVTIVPEASVYGMDKKRLGRVPAGTPFKVIRHVSDENEEVIICTIVLGGKRLPQAIIRKRNAALHDGALGDTTEAERDLRVRHAKLLAGITTRENQLRDNSNPHRAEYVAASREYKQFAVRNNTLIKEYDSAEGPRRMELADELRKLKLGRAAITKRYEKAKQRYAEWKEKNPASSPDYESDPKIKRLRQEVAGVEQKLSTL